MSRNLMNNGNGDGNGRNTFDVFFQDFGNELKKDLWGSKMMVEESPKVDVRENEKAYIMEADLPGFKESDIEISIKDKVLTLSCKRENSEEKKNENEIYLMRERSRFTMRRIFSFAENIDEEAVTAVFENGVLEVNIPKKEEKKSLKIAVNTKK